ncbi:MAG: hypothetical protein V7767_11480 [Leeuwenhoekiella sp.]
MPSGNQVLVTKQWDDDTEEDQINQTTEIDGVKASMVLSGFKNEEVMEKGFNDYDMKKAQAFGDAMIKLITQKED